MGSDLFVAAAVSGLSSASLLFILVPARKWLSLSEGPEDRRSSCAEIAHDVTAASKMFQSFPL